MLQSPNCNILINISSLLFGVKYKYLQSLIKWVNSAVHFARRVNCPFCGPLGWFINCGALAFGMHVFYSENANYNLRTIIWSLKEIAIYQVFYSNCNMKVVPRIFVGSNLLQCETILLVYVSILLVTLQCDG